MAKIFLNTLVAVLLFTLVGCYDPDSGRSQLLPAEFKVAQEIQTGAGETDYVEQMKMSRQAYRQALESLLNYYKNTGNNMKLTWAKDELNSLDKMPQYNYVIEAAVAGPELKATEKIQLADYAYEDAKRMEKKAGMLLVIKDENMLRLALNEYNLLIRKYPTSDKIDDAAYRAAGILQHFKDYSIAVLYYQRAYQWNAKTPYPSRYRAASILDYQLHQRFEALELYRQSIEKENLDQTDKELVVRRIIELTKSEDKPVEKK